MQALENDSAASYGTLYPPLHGVVKLTNFDTLRPASAGLRFRNWNFTNKIFIPLLSLVAQMNDEIVGHILFFPVKIVDIKSEYESIASVIVLGHPEYYPRFGFKRASNWKISAPFDVPDEAFMALELTEEGLRNVRGVVQYPAEFKAV